MSGEERGDAEKARVMLTAEEADCGRGTEHTFQGKSWSGARHLAGSP